MNGRPPRVGPWVVGMKETARTVQFQKQILHQVFRDLFAQRETPWKQQVQIPAVRVKDSQ